MSQAKKLRLGWFSFTCCEDSTIMFTELMNEHFFEWKKLIDFRHARVLKAKNTLDELDVAFVEGAIASDIQAEKLKEIRSKSKKLIAIGSCAVTGFPSAQRNLFPPEMKAEIQHILDQFHHAEKIRRLDEIVPVDAIVPGCPMDTDKFIKLLNQLLIEFDITPITSPLTTNG